jgi:3-oxoacyl-(acyl-carrier-protein) synthase
MMNLHVVAMGKMTPKVFTGVQTRFQADSSFRKATRNMMMGYAAIEPLLAKVPQLAKAAFVLGSSYGELEVTKEFLNTLDTQGLARPVLFQSSLHNATLGFLSLKLGIRGPSITVSHRYLTGENCLEAASLMIESGVELCLTAAVDTRATGILIDEGAAALLLTNEQGAHKLGLPTLAVIESVRYGGSRKNEGPPLRGEYYDSNALEKVVDFISSGTPGSITGELQLMKPNRTFSTIRFQ